MKLGRINELEVKREADISYILTDGVNEIFLHKKEAEKPYEIGERISVFLYDDNQGRITASTRPPSLKIDEIALLDVVSTNYNYGAFLYYGMVKDLLLSIDDLPKNHRYWPKPNDKIFVGMKEKQGRLFAKLLTRYDLKNSFSLLDDLEPGNNYDAFMMYYLDNGIVCFTEKGNEIFIHRNNYRDVPRIGQKLDVKILTKNEFNYSGTLIAQKELMLDKDANIVYQYLLDHDGEMPYTDKSDVEEIYQIFHMSKGAFKRALGHLNKYERIVLNKENTKIRR
ncbi:MAG: S1-like domain-containing RNA-binding protein [Candidatus Izemoplasmatales bacterium]|nr:S1-like domain-containing RNA-binding protein [Candidatus Izemoplasmatales bacterium]MDY0139887.1 S1-like domain-containing RNA-binding protein [Candidatus Izemoplasmatales bacterium]